MIELGILSEGAWMNTPYKSGSSGYGLNFTVRKPIIKIGDMHQTKGEFKPRVKISIQKLDTL